MPQSKTIGLQKSAGDSQTEAMGMLSERKTDVVNRPINHDACAPEAMKDVLCRHELTQVHAAPAVQTTTAQ